MAESWAVISAMGNDRVGIAEEIANTVESWECNIEESRMAVLGDQFAVIMLIRGPGEPIQNLIDGKESWKGIRGITVEVKAAETKKESLQGLSYLVETISLDSPGIVHALTRVLRDNDINIEDLESETTSAPFTGSPMFTMKIRVTVPSHVSPAFIREALNEIALERDLDVKFEPVAGSFPS